MSELPVHSPLSTELLHPGELVDLVNVSIHPVNFVNIIDTLSQLIAAIFDHCVDRHRAAILQKRKIVDGLSDLIFRQIKFPQSI